METIKENNGIHVEKIKQGKTRKPKEPLAELMGEIGKWQLWRIAIVFWLGIPGIAHVFSSAFIAAKTDYWCKDDLVDDILNYTLDTLPFGIPANKNACDIGCKSFGYDHSFWYSTIIMEWDLVCEWSYLSVIAKMVFFAGFAFGTFGAGLISDRYGRKSAIILMAQMLFGCGILATTMSHLVGFTVIWFFTGVAAMGTYTVCFVWAMESVSGRWKTFTSTFMNFAWPIARLGVVGVAATGRDWKTLLQIISAVHIVTPLLMNFVPESPRWLLASERLERRQEAKRIVQDAARYNGIYTEETDTKIDALINKKVENKKKTLGFLDIFRSKILLKRTMIMYYNWFTNSFILYGLSLNWQALTGSLFTNFMIGAALDFPAKAAAALLVIKCGRRWPYIICVFGSGVSFLCMLAFNRGEYLNDWPIVACAMCGNVFISTSFAILWVYTAEIYPTNVRNAGLGSCSLVARIGGVLSNIVGRLAEIHIAIPTILFGVSALLASLLALMLPETAGKPLPNTIEECEREFKPQGRRASKADAIISSSRRNSSLPK